MTQFSIMMMMWWHNMIATTFWHEHLISSFFLLFRFVCVFKKQQKTNTNKKNTHTQCDILHITFHWLNMIHQIFTRSFYLWHIYLYVEYFQLVHIIIIIISGAFIHSSFQLIDWSIFSTCIYVPHLIKRTW